MTEVTIYCNRDKSHTTLSNLNIYKVVVENHSELTELCNAISTLMFALSNYVWSNDLKNNNAGDVAEHINTNHEIDKEKGYFMFEIKRGITNQIITAFDFFYMSILMLQDSYPSMINVKIKQGNFS
mgnify:CR=1 FL=1